MFAPSSAMSADSLPHRAITQFRESGATDAVNDPPDAVVRRHTQHAGDEAKGFHLAYFVSRPFHLDYFILGRFATLGLQLDF